MKKDNIKNTFSGLKINKKVLSDKEKEKMLSVFLDNMTQSDLRTQKPKVRTVSYLSRIFLAASVIGLICVFAWKYIPNKTISTSELRTVTLSDNTTVTLRPGAKLSYSPLLFRFTRNVRLSGEAWFDVRTKGHFSVTSTLAIVNVLGTEFSVNTDPVFSTQCYRGMVEVLSNQTRKTVTLHAGEQVNIVNGAFTKSSISERAPYWVNNKFEFRNQLLSEVISIMAKHYHIQVNGLKSAEGFDFTGSFPADNLDIACQLIFGPYNLSYQLEDDTLSIETSH